MKTCIVCRIFFLPKAARSRLNGLLQASFVSKQPKLGPKLVSVIPKQDVCFECFALISKQGVSAFRNNRNKQKTNRNSSNFVKISTFLIPNTVSSVCFGCFDTGPKHQNKPKQKFGGFPKKHTEKQPKQIEFWLVSVRTEKKNLRFRGPPNRERFLEIFSVCFSLFRENSACFGCFDTGPKHRNKPKKKFFGFVKQTEEQPKQIEFRFVSVLTENFFYCFEDTLAGSCMMKSVKSCRRQWLLEARSYSHL
jgi:hypothetical protein